MIYLKIYKQLSNNRHLYVFILIRYQEEIGIYKDMFWTYIRHFDILLLNLH